MRLILIRHGDAHAGLHGVIAGPKGCRGLTDLGRRQAALLADRLATRARTGDHRLISSELPRAVETAQIIAPALGIEEIPRDCDLCEVHTGDADGTEWADHLATFGSFDMVAEPDRVFAAGGDSWNSFHNRVHAALLRLATEHDDATVFVVCHAGVIAAALTSLLGLPRTSSAVRLAPSNTGLTEWEFDPEADQWILRSFNDSAHLEPLERST